MPVEGRGLSSRQTHDVVKDLEIGQPINSKECPESADGVARERRREVLSESRMRGAIGEADVSLPVQVWSVQSQASRAGASLAGVAATRGPKRRQRLNGV